MRSFDRVSGAAGITAAVIGVGLIICLVTGSLSNMLPILLAVAVGWMAVGVIAK